MASDHFGQIGQICNGDIHFKSSARRTRQDHGSLNSAIDPAVDRFRALDDDEQKGNFKNALIVFVRTYAFLAQIMPFDDVDLEKFYAYVRHLLKKLPKRSQREMFRLQDKVVLEYYRLQKIKEGLFSYKNMGTQH